MGTLISILAAVAATVPTPVMPPEQRDTQCLVALRAERNLGPMSKPAKSYFDERVKKIGDPELSELLMLSAEEAILPNTNRRAIAANCLLLYQVLLLQEKTTPASGRPTP